MRRKLLQLILLAVFLAGAFVGVGEVKAGSKCVYRTTYWYVILGCRITNYEKYEGYCANTDVWKNLPVSCDASCTTKVYKRYSLCRRLSDGKPGDSNENCKSGRPDEGNNWFGLETIGCWVNCNENNWTACSVSCGGGTQTNDCGETRSCNTQTCPPPTPTPTPATGTIKSRAMVVTSADTSCTAVRSSSTGVSGTVHQFTPGSASQPAPQTQSGITYTQFNSLPLGSYTLSPVAPANYLIKRACWAKLPVVSQGEGLSQTLGAGETLTWDLGYTVGNAWVQAKGGDVYASGTLASLTPSGISPRVFILDGTTGESPGVATYGTDYDFAIETTGSDPKGASFVSSEKWLVNETYPSANWYDVFYYRFGSPTAPDYDCSVSHCTVSQPAPRATPYYVVGDMATQGNWSVGEGQTLIFLVNGNLTINGNVNLTGKGFVGFIVNGNISVSSSVGAPYTSSTPDIEGVYVTSPTGTFATGASTTPGKARLVLKGTFVAGNFLLQRDLDIVGQNLTTSAELFIYNPMLLITMPEAMKERKINWQEVAP